MSDNRPDRRDASLFIVNRGRIASSHSPGDTLFPETMSRGELLILWLPSAAMDGGYRWYSRLWPPSGELVSPVPDQAAGTLRLIRIV